MDGGRTGISDPVTARIIGLAMKVHRALGPGFLETVYRRALLWELKRAGLHAEEERRIAVLYEGKLVGDFVADIVVDGTLIVELKAVETLHKAHELQVVNYLTATSLDVGLLINFGGDRLQFKRKYRRRPRALDRNPVNPPDPVNPV